MDLIPILQQHAQARTEEEVQKLVQMMLKLGCFRQFLDNLEEQELLSFYKELTKKIEIEFFNAN
jgi:hypothetical protein